MCSLSLSLRGKKHTPDLCALTSECVRLPVECVFLPHAGKKHTPDLAYVHWWFYPDSYDDWVPQWEVEGEEEVPERKERWRVCVRWLRDSYKFNEWMNELDYEPDEDGEKRAGRWDAEEDSMLWQAYKELGRDFVSIRKRLVARPVASIKGRLKILINKEEKRKADAAAGIVEEEGAGGKKEKKEKAKKEGEKGKRDADGAAKGGGGGRKARWP